MASLTSGSQRADHWRPGLVDGVEVERAPGHAPAGRQSGREARPGYAEGEEERADTRGRPRGRRPAGRPAQRVVSLVPSLTEALAVTVPDRLVGATEWCTHPAGLDVPRVRGTKNPDHQAIAGPRPRPGGGQPGGEPAGRRRTTAGRGRAGVGDGHRVGRPGPRVAAPAAGRRARRRRARVVARRPPPSGPARPSCRPPGWSSRSGGILGWWWARAPSAVTWWPGWAWPTLFGADHGALSQGGDRRPGRPVARSGRCCPTSPTPSPP